MHQPAISLERVTVLLNVKREEDGKQATNKAQKAELGDIYFTSALGYVWINAEKRKGLFETHIYFRIYFSSFTKPHPGKSAGL